MLSILSLTLLLKRHSSSFIFLSSEDARFILTELVIRLVMYKLLDLFYIKTLQDAIEP